MNTKPSPRPWRVADYPQCHGLADIFDASGSPSGLVAGELRPADAALIVDAVNFYDATVDTQLSALLAERDRLRDELTRKAKNYEDVIAYHQRTEESLRDLVKRMIPFVEKCHSDALDLSKTIKGICALKGVDTSEIDRINSEHDALLREARAAIGEGAK